MTAPFIRSGANRTLLQLRGACSSYQQWHTSRDPNCARRGGRAVNCAGLENRKAERPREFESHPLRSCFAPSALRRIGKIARSRMPSEALAKEGHQKLYYVYLIESLSVQGERYVGMTTDLKQRLQEHNAGKSSHTSKFRPWKLTTYIAFTDRIKAEAFEQYLKSGSGHAFASKRLW